jgi:hypothetical protein
MNYKEYLENLTSETLYFENVISIIQNPSEKYLKYTGNERTIYFENFIIKCRSNEFISFDDDINIKLRLQFKDCFFDSENTVFISGMICENYVTFDNCYFPNGLHIYEGKFLKELALKCIHAKDFHLTGGEFDKITFSCYDLIGMTLSGGTFKQLDIGYWVGGNDIKDLTIINNNNELGNIDIRGHKISKLYLGGNNVDNSYNFKGIKCNNILISDFINSGSLNFFGVEPIDVNKSGNYFQIVNSNLNKAQFYNTKFSCYKEFIIINSYIIECLFIGCRWKSNIRSLRGPGYGNFDESSRDNRKIDSEEYFAIKEAYRQLKLSMNKHSDKIQEHEFYSKEMTIHNHLLKWAAPWKNTFWDKLVLHFSKIFSDYGQSFIKPLFYLLLGHFVFFGLALLFNGYEPLHVSFSNPTTSGFKVAFEKYFIYINPFRRLETSLSGYLIVLDLLMRIWSSYMLFNIVRASRRFIS